MLKGIVSGVEKDIKRIPMKGKNLFDGIKYANTSIGSVDRWEYAASLTGSVYRIPCKSRTTYTLYLTEDMDPTIWSIWRIRDIATDSVPNPSSTSVQIAGSYASSIPANRKTTFTTSSNAKYILFQSNEAIYEHMLPVIMLVEGESILPYEPYGYQEGWEVRDNQDRLIWGREDELQTTTGTLPFKGYGLPVKVKSLLGNGSQTGTPTPDAPIMPTFCGVRTGNLFDISSVIYGTWTNGSGVAQSYGYGARSVDIPSSQITVSFNGLAFPYSYSIVWIDSNGGFITRSHISSATQIREPQTFTPPSNAAKFYIQLANGTNSTSPITEEQIESYKLMLNLGGTALPYEPYGWAEKITCAGQTTPVYLGQVRTVRRIKKLVFDGGEPWVISGNIAYINNTNTKQLSPLICTHFQNVQNTGMWNGNNWIFQVNISNLGMTEREAWIAYLQQQYAAGTPVTVWYVLTEPTTGIVNEPLCKIGDYADELNDTVATLPEIPTTTGQNTLTVDTTLAPSNLTVKGHVKALT